MERIELRGEYYNGSISYCYNTGAVSGSSSVGGVCGLNHGTISNCYFDNNKCNYNAVVDGYGTVTNTSGKTTEEFASVSAAGPSGDRLKTKNRVF